MDPGPGNQLRSVRRMVTCHLCIRLSASLVPRPLFSLLQQMGKKLIFFHICCKRKNQPGDEASLVPAHA